MYDFEHSHENKNIATTKCWPKTVVQTAGDKVELDAVDFVESRLSRLCDFELAPYTLETKSKGRSTFKRQKSPTFDNVDQVERVQIWRQR